MIAPPQPSDFPLEWSHIAFFNAIKEVKEELRVPNAGLTYEHADIVYMVFQCSKVAGCWTWVNIDEMSNMGFMETLWRRKITVQQMERMTTFELKSMFEEEMKKIRLFIPSLVRLGILETDQDEANYRFTDDTITCIARMYER